MNITQPLNLVTLILIACGSILMFVSAIKTRSVFKPDKKSAHNKLWRFILFLVLLTTIGYFLAIYLFLNSLSSYLLVSLGFALLASAIIVFLSMNMNILNIDEILTKTKELEIASSTIEVQSDERSRELQHRILQLRTSTDISKIISGVKDKQLLLIQLVNLLQERLNLYYVGIFLTDEFHQFAILQAGSGEAGKIMLANNHRLLIEDTSMIGWAINNKMARIALDVGQDAVRFANPNLPFTRSELALPIILGNQVFGAITIQSTKEVAFDQDDIASLQSIADTLAIALENARLFNELKQKLEEIQTANSQYLINSWSSRIKSGNLEYTYQNPITVQIGDLPSIEIPLTLRDNIIGRLTLDGLTVWTDDEKNLVDAIAAQTALALENARLLEESKHIASREQLIANISNKVWASPYIDTILKTAIKELGQALKADEAIIELNIEPIMENTKRGDE
jgi:GAF domain-containing protein